MIIFVDSNIILDVMLPNPQFYDESCIYNALNSDWKDFEDSVQHQIAQQINADLIVTRNSSDYSHSSVRIMSPKEYLAFISE